MTAGPRVAWGSGFCTARRGANPPLPDGENGAGGSRLSLTAEVCPDPSRSHWAGFHLCVASWKAFFFFAPGHLWTTASQRRGGAEPSVPSLLFIAKIQLSRLPQVSRSCRCFSLLSLAMSGWEVAAAMLVPGWRAALSRGLPLGRQGCICSVPCVGLWHLGAREEHPAP